MVQWLRIKSELDMQKNLGMIFSIMDNEQFLLFSEVRSASGKKNRKKKEKKRNPQERELARETLDVFSFFFFLLAGQTSPKSRDFLQSVSVVGSAFDFCSSKFSLDVFVERVFFFFWSIQHKQPTVYVTSFRLRLFLRKKTLSNFSFFFF